MIAKEFHEQRARLDCRFAMFAVHTNTNKNFVSVQHIRVPPPPSRRGLVVRRCRWHVSQEPPPARVCIPRSRAYRYAAGPPHGLHPRPLEHFSRQGAFRAEPFPLLLREERSTRRTRERCARPCKCSSNPERAVPPRSPSR